MFVALSEITVVALVLCPGLLESLSIKECRNNGNTGIFVCMTA